jgi:uncharacterized protein YoxC
MIALSDAAWISIASIIASLATLVGILFTHSNVTSVGSKVDSVSETLKGGTSGDSTTGTGTN